MTDAERERVLLLWKEGKGMSLRMLERHFEYRFKGRDIRKAIVDAGLEHTISKPRGDTWKYRREAPIDRATGSPIGKIPPGHPLYAVDQAAMRDRALVAQLDAERKRLRARDAAQGMTFPSR